MRVHNMFNKGNYRIISETFILKFRYKSESVSSCMSRENYSSPCLPK